MHSLIAFALVSALIAPATPAPADSQTQPPAEQAVEVATATGALQGTLVIPAAAGKVPVALIIAGSGPTDRDGNSRMLPGKNNAYKMLADSLAAEGVASVRYDKRGVGASRAAAGTREADLRFDMYVDDAVAWLTRLRGDDRFSRTIVVGHSEGSLIGMLAARRAGADGFVSIAGVARRATEVLRDQLRPQIGTLPQLWADSESILASLEGSAVVNPLPPAIQSVPGLASLYRPSVQPYMISWIKYVPATEIAALRIPVLILQGTTDIQVSVDEAKALKTAKPESDLDVIEGMNHVMKNASAERAQNVAAYSNPDLPIVPEVPRAVAAFAKGRAAR